VTADRRQRSSSEKKNLQVLSRGKEARVPEPRLEGRKEKGLAKSNEVMLYLDEKAMASLLERRGGNRRNEYERLHHSYNAADKKEEEYTSCFEKKMSA